MHVRNCAERVRRRQPVRAFQVDAARRRAAGVSAVHRSDPRRLSVGGHRLRSAAVRRRPVHLVGAAARFVVARSRQQAARDAGRQPVDRHGSGLGAVERRRALGLSRTRRSVRLRARGRSPRSRVGRHRCRAERREALLDSGRRRRLRRATAAGWDVSSSLYTKMQPANSGSARTPGFGIGERRHRHNTRMAGPFSDDQRARRRRARGDRRGHDPAARASRRRNARTVLRLQTVSRR